MDLLGSALWAFAPQTQGHTTGVRCQTALRGYVSSGLETRESVNPGSPPGAQMLSDARYILGELNTWGWVTLIIGVVPFIAAFSLVAGGGFGRWIGIFAASASAIVSLLSIPAYRSGRY